MLKNQSEHFPKCVLDRLPFAFVEFVPDRGEFFLCINRKNCNALYRVAIDNDTAMKLLHVNKMDLVAELTGNSLADLHP